MSARVALVVIAGLAALPAVAHGEARPRYGSTLEASLLGGPGTLDPQAAQSHAELTLVELVFDTLYRVGPTGTVASHLAAGLPVLDAARTTATIALRPQVRFHDGSLLTAGDVVASLERLRSGVARWTLASVSGVRVVGDGTAIELALRAPVPDLGLLLALPQAAITRGGAAPTGRTAVGSGAFVLEWIDDAQRTLKLRAFDDHFAGRPYLDHLVLRWFATADAEARRFETGVAQLSARGVGAFATSRPKYAAAAVQGPLALLVFVGFGSAHGGLTRDPAFRRALDLALAREPLKAITTGERVAPTRVPLPPDAGGGPLAATARFGDLPAAQAALAEAAARIPALQPARRAQLALEILVEDARPDDQEIAEKVVHALDKLDLAAAITRLPSAALRERVARGACDLWIGQLATLGRQPALWWSTAFAAGGDPARAQAAITGALTPAAAAQAFAAELPIVPLMFRGVRLWHRTDVRGLRLDTAARPGFADVFVFGDPSRAVLPKARRVR